MNKENLHENNTSSNTIQQETDTISDINSSYEKQKKIARMAAIILLIIIGGLLIATILVALFGGENRSQILMVLYWLDIVVPIVTWFYVRLVKNLHDKNRRELEDAL